MKWTDEHIEMIKRLWIEGKSAAEIMREMPGTTRSGVIGKLNRLGVAGSKGTHSRPTWLIPGRTAPRLAKPSPPRPMSEPKPKGHPYINQGGVIYGGNPHTSPLQKKLDAIRANAVAATVDLSALRTVQTDTPPRPWLTRKFGECAYPVSGEGADVFSCCAPTSGASSYCGAHARLCFNPAPKPKPYDPNRPDGRRHNGFNFAAKKRAVNE